MHLCKSCIIIQYLAGHRLIKVTEIITQQVIPNQNIPAKAKLAYLVVVMDGSSLKSAKKKKVK
jgi:hypothetical protein